MISSVVCQSLFLIFLPFKKNDRPKITRPNSNISPINLDFPEIRGPISLNRPATFGGKSVVWGRYKLDTEWHWWQCSNRWPISPGLAAIQCKQPSTLQWRQTINLPFAGWWLIHPQKETVSIGKCIFLGVVEKVINPKWRVLLLHYMVRKKVKPQFTT